MCVSTSLSGHDQVLQSFDFITRRSPRRSYVHFGSCEQRLLSDRFVSLIWTRNFRPVNKDNHWCITAHNGPRTRPWEHRRRSYARKTERFYSRSFALRHGHYFLSALRYCFGWEECLQNVSFCVLEWVTNTSASGGATPLRTTTFGSGETALSAPAARVRQGRPRSPSDPTGTR